MFDNLNLNRGETIILILDDSGSCDQKTFEVYEQFVEYLASKRINNGFLYIGDYGPVISIQGNRLVASSLNQNVWPTSKNYYKYGGAGFDIQTVLKKIENLDPARRIRVLCITDGWIGGYKGRDITFIVHNKQDNKIDITNALESLTLACPY